VQRVESLLLSPMTFSTESASQVSVPPYLQPALQKIQQSGMIEIQHSYCMCVHIYVYIHIYTYIC